MTGHLNDWTHSDLYDTCFVFANRGSDHQSFADQTFENGFVIAMIMTGFVIIAASLLLLQCCCYSYHYCKGFATAADP